MKTKNEEIDHHPLQQLGHSTYVFTAQDVSQNSITDTTEGKPRKTKKKITAEEELKDQSLKITSNGEMT